MRLVAGKVDVLIREVDAFVAPVCAIIGSLFGLSGGIVSVLDRSVLLRGALRRNVLLGDGLERSPSLRDALHAVLNWSARLLLALSVGIYVKEFLNTVLWVGMATRMLD